MVAVKACALFAAWWLLAAHAPAEPPLITSTRELRTLSGEEAAQKRAVRVRGVVTFVEPKRTIFIQDDGAGTFVHLTKQKFEAQPGDVIEVEGVSYAGLYVPGVEPDTLRIV